MNIQIHFEDQKLVLQQIYDFRDLKKRLQTLVDRKVEEISYLDGESDLVTICSDTDLAAIDELESVIFEVRGLEKKMLVDKPLFDKYYQYKYTKEKLLEVLVQLTQRLNKYEGDLLQNIEQEQQLKNIEYQVTQRLPQDIQTAGIRISKFRGYSNRQFKKNILDELTQSKFWAFVDKMESMTDFEIIEPATEISYQKQLKSEIKKRIMLVEDRFESIYSKRTKSYESNLGLISVIKHRKVKLLNELHSSKTLLYQKQRQINFRTYWLNHQILVTKSLLEKYM